MGAGSRCPRTRGEPSPQGRTHRGGLSLALAGGLDRRGPSVARSKTASCPQVWHKWESHVAHRPCPPPETKATGPQGHRRCPATPQGPGPGGGTGSTRAVWGLGPLRRSLQRGALSRPPARPPARPPSRPSCLASGILPEAAPDRRDRHEGHTGRVTAPGLPEEVPWALDGDPRVSASPENAQAASPLSPQVVSPQTHRCQDSLPGTTSAVRWALPSSSPTPGPGLLQGAGRGPTCRGPPAGHGLSFLTQARGRPPPGHMPRRYLGHRGQASLGRLPLAVCGCPGERPWASVAGREGGSGSAPDAAPLPPPESSGPAAPVPPGLRVPLGLRSSALRARPESRVPAKHRGAAASPPPVLWLVGGGHLPEQGRWPGPSSLRCGVRAAAVHGVPSGGGAGPEPLPTPTAGLAGASPLTCLNTQRAAGPGGHSAF